MTLKKVIVANIWFQPSHGLIVGGPAGYKKSDAEIKLIQQYVDAQNKLDKHFEKKLKEMHAIKVGEFNSRMIANDAELAVTHSTSNGWSAKYSAMVDVRVSRDTAKKVREEKEQKAKEIEAKKIKKDEAEKQKHLKINADAKKIRRLNRKQKKQKIT